MFVIKITPVSIKPGNAVNTQSQQQVSLNKNRMVLAPMFFFLIKEGERGRRRGGGRRGEGERERENFTIM